MRVKVDQSERAAVNARIAEFELDAHANESLIPTCRYLLRVKFEFDPLGMTSMQRQIVAQSTEF